MSYRAVLCDLQGFYGRDKEFIVKEAAFMSLSGAKFQSFLFKSPYPLSYLNIQQQQNVHWVKKFKHGLDWSDGFIPYFELSSVFNNILSQYQIIFVKGLEKRQFIKSIIMNDNISVVNLEIYGCPKISDILKLKYTRRCFNHSNGIGLCATENVRLLHNWYVHERLGRSNLTKFEENVVNKIGKIIHKYNNNNSNKHDCNKPRLANLKIEEMEFLPNEFYLNYVDRTEILCMWNKLPLKLKKKLHDDLVYCYEHYNEPGTTHVDGPARKKVDCAKCMALK